MKKLICLVALVVLLFSASAILAKKSRKKDSVELLYAKRCAGSCHRLYAPDEYTGEQWAGVLVKMAPVAKLTEEEHAAIRNYLIAPAAVQESSSITVTGLTEQLHLLTTDQGAYTTNSIAFVGEDGLLLVDSQAESDAEELKKAVDSFGKGAPKYIINTHRHVEHVGGNAIFGEAPVVIAHDLVPQKLRSGSYIFDEFPDATFPDITFEDSLTLYFNGERIELRAMAGSHDDNEIIVHFTGSKVVHLSSLTNGFNFPSIDADGDVLKFEELVAAAIEMLPQDVVIVSGHNDTGSWNDLVAYREMLVATAGIVRRGLAEGKDVAAMQQAKVLQEWKSYAGSYVSSDEWIEYLAGGLQDDGERKKTLFEPLYHLWKKEGAKAAVAHYSELKKNRADEYDFDEFTLLVIGDKLLKKGHARAAVEFLEASLLEYPDSKYGYYTNYRIAAAHNSLGGNKLAAKHCERAVELNPEFEPDPSICGK
jgi:glyoxylase-like metal-dependent hydrolase (beta-lactamase superfamily II)